MDKKKIANPLSKKVSAATRRAGMAAMSMAMSKKVGSTKKHIGQINRKEKKI